MGLREAKDLVERMNAGLATAPVTWTSSATIDWAGLPAMTKIEKIAAVRKQTGLDLAQAKALVEAMDGSGGGTGGDATSRMMNMLSGRTTS